MQYLQSKATSHGLLHSTDGGITYTASSAAGPSYTTAPEDVPVQGELKIVHRDEAIIVVEKPAFLPTENTRTIRDSVRSRIEALVHKSDAENCEQQQQTERTVYVPHRLDWETSGLLVLALNADAMRSLSDQFAGRSVHKVYIADVTTRQDKQWSEGGTIELPLSSDPERLPRQRVDFGSTGKAARTEWAVERCAAHACRLRLTPESGRRHQLRMHCLSLGSAIAGDGLYEMASTSATVEKTTRHRPTRLHLHAAELRFAHPVSGELLSFSSEPPFALEDASRWGEQLAAALVAVPTLPWVLALTLAFSSSTDNFAVGLSVALAGSPLPTRVNVIIAFCNAAGAMAAASVGVLLGRTAPTIAPAAAAAIFGYLAHDEFSSWSAGESSSPLARSAADGLAWKLALPMTLNNLAGGVASGVAGVSGAFAGGCALVASYLMMEGGYALGHRLGSLVEATSVDPRVCASAIFVAMALVQARDAASAGGVKK